MTDNLRIREIEDQARRSYLVCCSTEIPYPAPNEPSYCDECGSVFTVIPDRCPTCRRLISDTDSTGCETETGQRYCLDHLPRSAAPDLFDRYQRLLARTKARPAVQRS